MNVMIQLQQVRNTGTDWGFEGIVIPAGEQYDAVTYLWGANAAYGASVSTMMAACKAAAVGACENETGGTVGALDKKVMAFDLADVLGL